MATEWTDREKRLYDALQLAVDYIGDGCGPFDVLNALEDKGAIKMTVNKAEGDLDIVVTDAGLNALRSR